MKLNFAALAVSLVSAGCTERAPRSFVQPNVIKKADLTGTDGSSKWYYIQTVVDAPPTSAFMFVGNSSELMKVKFDIEEEVLFARRSYEQIQGSEDAYGNLGSRFEGQPVAAWPVKSQFDIIRDYNATTGEETNKIIESTERPWNEREFIRVDWSNNLLTANDVLGLGINFFFEEGVSVESASFWESDPTSPDAFHMERADDTDAAEFDKGEANFMDVTNKWVISPTQKTINFEENGQPQSITYPACFLSYQTDDCASQVVKVRHSFAKISPKHQYDPRNWDGQQMNLFGIWDVGLNRLSYNRQYGVTNSGFKRHAARFNIWNKSMQDDGKTRIEPQNRLDGDGNPDTRTIPYYAESSTDGQMVGGYPSELFEQGRQIIKSWSDAVAVAVQDVTTKVPARPIFTWCHNPVKLASDDGAQCDATKPGFNAYACKDDDACKSNIKPILQADGSILKDPNTNQPIYRVRQGDPRRSTIFWVNQEQNAGPLGYGPPLFDPETGETVSGQAYIYGAALDTYAARSRDLVLLVAGKLPADKYIAGQNVQEWVTKNSSGVANLDPTFTEKDVGLRSSAMDFSWAKGQAPEAPIDATSARTLAGTMQLHEDAMYKGGIFGQNNADLSDIRRARLKGTTLEGMMVNSDVMQMSGSGVGSDWSSLTDSEKMRVSPLRSEAVRQQINQRLDKMRAFGYDFADFADEGLAQRALQLANDKTIPNMDPEAIRQQLRKDIFLAVTLHEVGHNMGLRHNFRASFDAMNYFDQYWALRAGAAVATNAQRYAGIDAAAGTVIGAKFNDPSCGTAKRKGTIRPRYIDCPGGATSVSEVQGVLPDGSSTCVVRQDGSKYCGGVREFQYASIMDYGAEFNSDLMGLGKYDQAAMKFSYAGDGFVEVFAQAKTDALTQQAFASLHTFQNSYGFPSALGRGLTSINYTTFPNFFNGGSLTEQAGNIGKRKDIPYSDLITDTNPLSPTSGLKTDRRSGNPLVPYFFCSDEFVGNLTCARFDSGADAYEQVTDVISRYENFYLLNNFKRDRYTFHTSLGYKDRVASRYLDMMRNQLTWYALLRADFADFPGADNFFVDENGWGNFTVAVSQGFDAIGRVLTKPEAGYSRLVDAASSPDYPISYLKKAADLDQPQYSGLGDTQIGLIDGKYSDTSWDFDACGYYWADECQKRIGYFIDKTVALDVLSQSQAYFIGRDTSTDVRKYAIGYILPFKNQIQEKLGALLSGDYASFAPRLDTTDPNVTKVTQPNWTLNLTEGRSTTNLIDPAGGFTLQLYAGVYGLSAFPSTFDHSFIDTTRIFVVGNGEAPVADSVLQTIDDVKVTSTPGKTVADGGTAEWYVVKDSDTGKVYAAHATPAVADHPGGPSYRNDTAVRMLQTYQAIIAAAQPGVCGSNCAAKQLAVTQYKQNLDVMRSLHNAYGYATYKTDAPFIY